MSTDNEAWFYAKKEKAKSYYVIMHNEKPRAYADTYKYAKLICDLLEEHDNKKIKRRKTNA